MVNAIAPHLPSDVGNSDGGPRSTLDLPTTTMFRKCLRDVSASTVAVKRIWHVLCIKTTPAYVIGLRRSYSALVLTHSCFILFLTVLFDDCPCCWHSVLSSSPLSVSCTIHTAHDFLRDDLVHSRQPQNTCPSSLVEELSVAILMVTLVQLEELAATRP